MSEFGKESHNYYFTTARMSQNECYNLTFGFHKSDFRGGKNCLSGRPSNFEDRLRTYLTEKNTKKRNETQLNNTRLRMPVSIGK